MHANRFWRTLARHVEEINIENSRFNSLLVHTDTNIFIRSVLPDIKLAGGEREALDLIRMGTSISELDSVRVFRSKDARKQVAEAFANFSPTLLDGAYSAIDEHQSQIFSSTR